MGFSGNHVLGLDSTWLGLDSTELGGTLGGKCFMALFIKVENLKVESCLKVES